MISSFKATGLRAAFGCADPSPTSGETTGELPRWRWHLGARGQLTACRASRLGSSDQIDKVLNTTSMGEATNNAWVKLKAGLKTLSQQFGMRTSQSNEQTARR